jgi:hypothetical protein
MINLKHERLRHKGKPTLSLEEERIQLENDGAARFLRGQTNTYPAFRYPQHYKKTTTTSNRRRVHVKGYYR